MHSPQVTPDAAAQQLSGAAEEASRSFGVGKSFGGSSSGLEQGAAGTTLEPPAPGGERVLEQGPCDGRAEAHMGPEGDCRVSLEDLVPGCLLQVEVRASPPVPASAAAFATLL